MKLKHLTLCNFCQHENVEFDFSLGLSGILGHNGSGKSNLIQGVIYALTGTLRDNVIDYIRNGCDGADSYVSVVFESDSSGQEYTITRSLRPRKAELITPDKTIRGAKPVDAFLTDTLGIDFNVVKNILTVSQEDFVAFFRLTDSDRATLLQRLFGFMTLKTGREDLRKLLVATQENSDTDGAIKAFESLMEQEKNSLKEYKHIPKTDEIRRNKETIEFRKVESVEDLSRFNARKALAEHKALLEKRLEAAESALSGVSIPASTKPMERKLQDTERELAEMNCRVQEHAEQGEKLHNFKESLGTLYVCKEALSSVPEPGPQEERDALIQKQAVLHSKEKQYASCIKTGVCPTCGRPYENVQDLYKQVVEELDAVNKEVELDSIKRANYKAALRNVEAYTNMVEKEKAALYPTVPADFQLSDPLEPIEEALVKQGEKLQELLKKIKDSKDALALQIQEAKAAQEKYGAMQMECTVIKKELETATPAPVPLVFKCEEDAQKALTAFNENLSAIDEQWQKALARDSTQLRIFDLEDRLKKLYAQKSKDADRQKYRQALEEAYAILSPDAFPKQVLIGLLKMLCESINNYLLLFNAPFMVFIAEDSTELLCDFGDDMPMAAARLSGGQKVLLAVSWRLALHNTFATEESCGFLTLDEPTTFLDSNNIDNLSAVMQQVKQTAMESNLQILVITHEKSLEPLFDNVIDLG